MNRFVADLGWALAGVIAVVIAVVLLPFIAIAERLGWIEP